MEKITEIMNNNWDLIKTKLMLAYESALESDGKYKYTLYWDVAKNDCLWLEDIQGSNWFYRNTDKLFIATVDAPCVDVYGLCGVDCPEDPNEREAIHRACVEGLVDNTDFNSWMDALYNKAKCFENRIIIISSHGGYEGRKEII